MESRDPLGMDRETIWTVFAPGLVLSVALYLTVPSIYRYLPKGKVSGLISRFFSPQPALWSLQS